ncbi:hypothetical protein ZYGR_0I05620 [Zygosaccharomyces rouxii]|uniref:Alpha-1,3/1,6-mannosyltransferase ALG2 n=2 Tax=Zygosaccharomyces rouxii TaxID=4956 RepID=C5DU27_ZYGRC|nr:uncharacterized protein ZYRO0C13354g [Zygosaccharomyces rouxii]KAH9201536.1 hypothetical protein LQ764DRAFT_81214 [Zygosaccharomyces rouxii]GAV48265.1 hypothetical protein ZYGR_0I05620 [Zygosaccharomyces rouxii]CAR27288.1 ZYRO0C13354p [Zygosaccharomyces rouxii]
MSGANQKLKIAFVHPDLGIGGAERLVVDAAIGLQEQGHDVVIYTSHCDRSHCFEEIKNGLLKVEVYGDELPTNFLNKFYIVFANLRQLYLVLQLYLMGKINQHDLYITDQLSTCMPFLHMVSSAKLMFYCHFPDQLLAQRTSLIKKLYRVPFDLFEQFTMSAADCVVVNSHFTKSIYHKTFRFLEGEPDVIYPCVDLSFQSIEPIDQDFLTGLLHPHQRFYLSINRYERKKNILLALESYALSSESDDENSKLIVTGGYDERVSENVGYLQELQEAADKLKLSHTTIFYPEFRKNGGLNNSQALNSKVIFLTSISSSLKELLLSKMELLLYTPSFEHFGIVPLEAMKHGKPVLAVNTGGPLETVERLVTGVNENEATGWLARSDPKDWAKAIEEFKSVTKDGKVNFKKNGLRRVEKYYSRGAMTQSFERNIEKTIDKEKKTYFWETFFVGLLNFALHLVFQFTLEGQIWPYIGMSVIMGWYFHSVFVLFWVVLALTKIS